VRVNNSPQPAVTQTPSAPEPARMSVHYPCLRSVGASLQAHTSGTTLLLF
jgi:hypothetical protein